MIVLKSNSKLVIATTDSYQEVLINRINLKESLILLHNTDINNASIFRIYASLEHRFPNTDINSTDSTWYNILEEQILQPTEKALYKLTEPWRWLLIQIKNQIVNRSAVINIYHGGRYYEY